MGATQLDLTAMSEASWIAAPVSDLIVNCQKLDGGGREVARRSARQPSAGRRAECFQKDYPFQFGRYSLRRIEVIDSLFHEDTPWRAEGLFEMVA